MLSNTQAQSEETSHSQWQLMLAMFESQWNEVIAKPIVQSNHVHASSHQDKHIQGVISKLVQGVAHIKHSHLKYYNAATSNGAKNTFDEFTSKKIAELELMKPSKRQNMKQLISLQCNIGRSGNTNTKQQKTFLKQNDNDNNDYPSNTKVTIDDLIIQQQQQMKPKQKLQHVFESVGETMPSGVFGNKNNNNKRDGGVKRKRNLFLSNDNNNNNNINNNITCNNTYNNSISNVNTQHYRHRSFLREDEPKIEKKKKAMAADKIGFLPSNINPHPFIAKPKTNTNINSRVITHTSTPTATGSKSDRSSKIQKKIQQNSLLISEMMKLNNK